MPPRTPYNHRAAQARKPVPRVDGSPESVLRLFERGEFLVREGRTREAVQLYRKMQQLPAAGALEPWLSDTLAALAAPNLLPDRDLIVKEI